MAISQEISMRIDFFIYILNVNKKLGYFKKKLKGEDTIRIMYVTEIHPPPPPHP